MTGKTEIADVREVDLPELLAFGRQFITKESPAFRHLQFDETRLLTSLARAVCSDQFYLRGAFHNGVLTGALLGMIEQYYFALDLLASELGFYVVPDKRGSSAAFKLVRDFERWAEERGATDIVVSSTSRILKRRTSKFYSKLGYEETGTVHQKSLRGM